MSQQCFFSFFFRYIVKVSEVQSFFFFYHFFLFLTEMEPVFNYLENNWHGIFCYSFFQDGLKAVDNLKPSIEKLATDLHSVRDSSFLKHCRTGPKVAHTTDLKINSHF